MCYASTIVKQRQLAVRREMDRRGIMMKAVAADAKLSLPTLYSYFPADRHANPNMMPISVVFALAESEALPLDLLSWLLPEGFHILKAPAHIDHDELARGCLDYASEHAKARHPESPAGVDIAPCEDAALKAKAVRLAPVAS